MYVVDTTPHLVSAPLPRHFRVTTEKKCADTANPTWGDIFECCFKNRSSKLERLFCHVSVKRDVQTLSFEFWKSFRKCHPKWDWLYRCVYDTHVYIYIFRIYIHIYVYHIHTCMCTYVFMSSHGNAVPKVLKTNVA